MGNPFFRFKQFTVWHDKCAMKVGTDGVLLGAWCHLGGLTVDNAQCTILDVGTGSGLIALMLAQRMIDGGQCTMHDWVHIDAIDIDPQAVEQATYNFGHSPWTKRLHAHLCSLQQVSPLRGDLEGSFPTNYDLIVSNPPYFVDSLKNPDKGRELARHTDTLSYEDLLRHSARLLKEHGTLALVLPATAEEQIIRLASVQGLYPTRLTRVFSKPDHPTPIRILIEFVKSASNLKGGIEEHSLYIESAHSPRSEEYAEMTKDFYL
ncbi:MAG: methyltransferase domain-containing protein [Paludibacteraceae bacterium]|nr:methyltransferase domain-containing protein [Paludibacteraceae bacterium]